MNVSVSLFGAVRPLTAAAFEQIAARAAGVVALGYLIGRETGAAAVLIEVRR